MSFYVFFKESLFFPKESFGYFSKKPPRETVYLMKSTFYSVKSTHVLHIFYSMVCAGKKHDEHFANHVIIFQNFQCPILASLAQYQRWRKAIGVHQYDCIQRGNPDTQDVTSVFVYNSMCFPQYLELHWDASWPVDLIHRLFEDSLFIQNFFVRTHQMTWPGFGSMLLGELKAFKYKTWFVNHTPVFKQMCT